MVVAILFVLAAAGVVGGMVMKNRNRADHGAGDGGPVGEPAEVREGREKWKDAWQALKADLSFNTWKPGQNPQLAESAAAHLKEIEAKQIRTETVETLVTRWFSDEARDVQREVERIKDDPSSWTRNKEKVLKAQTWCDQMAIVAGGADVLKGPAAALQQIRDMATPITGFKGTFSLSVTVGPWAEIVELKSSEGALDIPRDVSRNTPTRLTEVKVADYKLILKHPEHGTVEVPLTGIEAGKSYVVTGLMSDKSTIKVTPQ
jgi:hypothetical protein